MAVWLAPQVPELARQMAAAEHVLLLLDYDGTLAPIVATPEQALPLPGTAELLRSLQASSKVSIAVITGRPIASLRRLFDLSEITYVGLHGAEVQRWAGAIETDPSVNVLRAAVPELRRRLESALGPRPGVWIEDKGVALACHYRQASPEDAADAKRVIEGLTAAYRAEGGRVSLLHGHEISELRSPDVDKGGAALALLRRCPPQTIAAYAGDDATDEDAFRRLPPSAITIRVGPPEVNTRARFRANGPLEVREWLERFFASLGSSS